MKTLSDYQKKKEFLVCVDSDGCAMDTMDIKHFRCFGPCMVDEWGLEKWRDAILTRWNEINLYTLTRGINRFRGLALALSEINANYLPIEGVEEFSNWAQVAPELSNGALESVIEKNPEDVIFRKALAWSKAVNKAITQLPDEEKLPFPMVREALAFAHGFADVAIVSSANLGAVLEEWGQHGLLEHTDVVLSQSDGSKAFCIGKLLERGYDRDKVVMCGDAPGDLAAAEKNGVYFYPILVRRERESWQEFIDVAAEKLTGGCYGGDYQDAKRQEFLKNLSK